MTARSAAFRRRDLRWVGVPLLLILVGAGLFRFTGLRWDAACVPTDEGEEPHCYETHLHPDERFLTMVADRIEPPSPTDYFDTANSSWNPRNHDFGFFVYGTWPIHLVDWISHRVGRDGYGGVHLVGRFLSASWSLATVLLLFALGRRVAGDAVGLLAALFLAASAMSIQHAHFFTSEAPLAFATTLTVFAAVRLQERIDGSRALAFGTAFGLAMAVKVSVISLALLAVVAVWIGASGRSAGDQPKKASWTARHPVLRRWILVGAAGVASLLVFRVLQPYAFRGPGLLGLWLDPQWLANMDEARRMAGGRVDFPPNHQWTDRTPWLFPWRNLVGVGLGPALGWTATAAWVWVGWRTLVRRRFELALPWFATTLIFVHQGGQWVKSLRYLMPIVPCLCLLAAWAVVQAIETAERTNSAHWRRIARGAATLIVLASLFWALAFTSIYRRPHTRVEASRWIYEHVAPGRTISNESWDDALPVPIDGRIGMGDYQGDLIDPYATDSPEKLETLLRTLASADYLVLSSNRGYDSVARLPSRYPMTIRYYDSLFDGSLGFRRVGEWTSYPQFLGLRFPDQHFEESVSVYDHPRVQIFERTPDFDVEAARERLTVDWDGIRPVTPRQAGSNTDMLLGGDTRARMEAAGLPLTARLESRRPSGVGAVLRWALVLEALAVGGFLLAFPIFPGLVDRGLLAMRAGSLLIFGWVVWFGASIHWTSFTQDALRVALSAWLGLAALAAWRQRRALGRWWADGRGPALRGLLVFWGAFLGMLAVRMANPDLWHPSLGGEKPMDLAYLGAVMRSVEFPPFDPWFAGGAMNYYYFGWVLTGALGLLTGLPVDLVYNLAIPTFFALFAGGAYAVGRRLARLAGSMQPARGGALAAGMLALCGNWAIWPLLKERVQGVSFPEHHLFWNPSRAIPFVEGETTPITEFPFFTFLFADLHAHLMALPFGLFLILVLLGGALAGDSASVPVRAQIQRRSPPLRPTEAGGLLLLALCTGAAWPINTWDAPTWLALTGLGLFVCRVGQPTPRTRDDRRDPEERPGVFAPSTLLHAAARVLFVFVLGRLLFLPFHQNFSSAYGSVALWQGSRTPLSAFLLHFGVVLIPLVLWVLLRHRPLRTAIDLMRERRSLLSSLLEADVRVAAILVVGVLLTIWSRPLDALLLALVAIAAVNLFRNETTASDRWIAGLLGLGAMLALSVEYVVLEGDISRMNTVFKFYLQIWWIWGLAASTAVISSFGKPEPSDDQHAAKSSGAPRWARRAATGMVVAGVLSSMAYPVVGTWARIRDRVAPEAPRGLDGRVFLEQPEIHDAGGPLDVSADLAAIRWLMEHESGSATLLEASVPEYRWGSRFSRFTGLPTVIGWNWHQRQQRAAAPGEPVRHRLEDLEDLYSGTDTERKRQLLREHRVRWVVVGELERNTYEQTGIGHLEALPGLRLAYRSGSTSIYEVDDRLESAASI